MRKVLLAITFASVVLLPHQSYAGFVPTEEELLTIISVLPALGVELEHQGVALRAGAPETDGVAVALLHTSEGPMWVLDEWTPMPDGRFQVVHWRFTFQLVKRGEFVRVHPNTSEMEIVTISESVHETDETNEKSRLTWNILCSHFPCDPKKVPLGP
ncbi:MAG: hypothetical protein A3I44_05150 [Candidatus Sungbacteria bacterium RIFCSPLOWO2_02_FULL_51_17]|uniref:Uncharacterized protein n=1 Tax=Candidatus Sungbacteria bacterium RIFCSPHIGHO2_02_FULL_51_29 TaxID=1802273 RepID=A0A1G2KSI7_9BACT|nr:MAG: hypothetical protein A2676_05120 [Candidatus Sungbacteria bacterium RIFCSPHIGHO2_01_FULL_51_22]OHA01542.1 MAG: hypothetical protein A3C16_05215 [Candidatus Sungbacteria bacterium RIFCSPHIGHO2_02_FULL_51_29]OHA07031.1 MAG: hypothetical protein A3B29_01220 [Candidatus Sungbacteria bacterium RIFCSPLOWO2_01_FULL_51_34]OHA11804.1 MAG: hypothetical protein A3I44_05150 [Candidatus Sungbacteria bacterium RIFCSPLOWO2_02_FULL_51_17]